MREQKHGSKDLTVELSVINYTVLPFIIKLRIRNENIALFSIQVI